MTAEHTLSKQDLSDITDRIRADGFSYLPCFDTSSLALILQQWPSVFAGEHQSVTQFSNDDGEHIATLGHQFMASQPLLSKVLMPGWFSQIGQCYFREKEPRLPVGVTFSQLSRAAGVPVSTAHLGGNAQVHWDPVLSLRMVIYLTDVTADKAPFEYVAKTHAENHHTRLQRWRQQQDYHQTLPCAQHEAEFTQAVGRAGTCFVFDTALTHRRGLFLAGDKRLVSFTHFYPQLGLLQNDGGPCPADEQLTLGHLS